MTKRLLLIPFFFALLTESNVAQSPYVVPPAKPIPQYDLAIKVMPEAHHMTGSGTVRIPAFNTAQETLGLGLSGLMRDFQVEVVEPSVCAGPAKLEKNGTAGQQILWAVRPPRPVPPHEPVVLRFSYQGGAR